MRTIILLSVAALLAGCGVRLNAAGGTAGAASRSPGPATTTSVRGAAPDAVALLAAWDASQARYVLSPEDSATGGVLPAHPYIALGDSFLDALSPGGDKAAIVSFHDEVCDAFAGGTRCRGSGGVLHLLDVAAWHEVTTTLPAKGTVSRLAFSPDARRLTLSYVEGEIGTVLLLDAGSGRVIAQRRLDFAPSLIEFAQDGDSVVCYGQPAGSPAGEGEPGKPRVVLLNGRTLEVRWQMELKDVTSGLWCTEDCQSGHQYQHYVEWGPAVVLSPDGQKLHIVHADEERLTTVDLGTGTARTIDIRAPQSMLERLLTLTAGVAEAKGISTGGTRSAAISPDGRRLYVVGQSWTAPASSGSTENPDTQFYGLREVEVESGNVLARLDSQASEVRSVLDGRYLLLSGSDGRGRWTELFLPNKLYRLAHLDGWDVTAIPYPGGSPLFLASRPGPTSSTVAVLDAHSFQPVRSWLTGGWARWVTGQ